MQLRNCRFNTEQKLRLSTLNLATSPQMTPGRADRVTGTFLPQAIRDLRTKSSFF